MSIIGVIEVRRAAVVSYQTCTAQLCILHAVSSPLQADEMQRTDNAHTPNPGIMILPDTTLFLPVNAFQ